jgi:hypothetical protein
MDPIQQEFLKETLLPFAREIAGTPYESYTGERVAGPTALTEEALSGYGALSLPSELATASGIVEGVATMTPEEMAERQAGYAQQYTDLVLDPTRARLRREQDIARSTEAGQMTRALGGAGFGASRRGVAEGEREAARDIGMAQLEADIGAAGLGYGSNRLMQELGITTGAAGQLAGLGMAGLGAETDILGRKMTAGEYMRGIDQARLDVPYEDYLAAMQYPLTQFGVLTGAGQAFPAGIGTTREKTPLTGTLLETGGKVAAAYYGMPVA